jgi:archaetidylinositol phosphate synthase
MTTLTDTIFQHVREHQSLTASAEKRLLVAIAGRLPRVITSDHLTLLALAAMLLAGAGYALARWDDRALWLVVIALGLNWFGDSLDGTLARVRGHQRPRYGYYVDHAIDLAGTLFLMTGLAVSGLMSPFTAVVVLAAYLLVSAETYLATHAAGVFRMSVLGVGPTELRVLIGIGALRAASDPVISLGPLGPARLFDVGGAIAAVALLVIFTWSAVRTGRELYRAEPLPRATDGMAA